MYKKVVVLIIGLAVIVGLLMFEKSDPNMTITKEIDDHDKTFYTQNEHTIVDVLYGTDRGLDEKAELNERYTAERSQLKFGVAQVSVPKIHAFGEIESPNWLRSFFGDKERVGKDVLIAKLEALKFERFRNILKLKLKNAKQSDILIFIHGFNVTFEDAIKRTAQISYDLEFKGVPLTYSWPSVGSLSAYARDGDSVMYTNRHLITFLTEVLKNRGDANVHILAHSMGTRALTNALKEMSLTNDKVMFKNIILAAPDIDTDIFRENLYPYILKTTEKITLYASSQDTALGISNTIHENKRLGQGGEEISVFKDMITVDATGIDTSLLGHSYFAEKEILVNDLRAVVQKSLPPQQRPNLLKRLKSKIFYWKFDVPEVETTDDWGEDDDTALWYTNHK